MWTLRSRVLPELVVALCTRPWPARGAWEGMGGGVCTGQRARWSRGSCRLGRIQLLGGRGGRMWGQEVLPEPLWGQRASWGWPPSGPPAGCEGLRRAGLPREAVPAAAAGRVGMRIAGVQLGGHRDTWSRPATGPLRQHR